MRNYFFVKVCILYIIPFGICLSNERKGSIYTQVIPDLLKKRTEYENNHRNMFTSAKEYETWPELSNEIQKELCEKHIKKIFKWKKRLIVSTINTYSWIYYPETQNKNGRLIERLIVATLKCEISPPADGRKYISFIRSPTNECLYLISHRATSSKEFYIAGEICEYGEYNYWHICHSKKYERKQKYSYLQRWRSDSEDKLKDYEASHLKDYLLHKNEYVKWLEFGKYNKNELCGKLLSEIFPRKYFSVVVATNEEVKLKYTKIVSPSEVISDLTVSAVKCHIPERKREKYFLFIKAPTQKCVHLIRRTNSKYFTFYIAKLFCEVYDVFRNVGQVDLDNIKRCDEPGTDPLDEKQEPLTVGK